MPDYNWIFTDADGTKTKATLNSSKVPTVGDGKAHNGKSYEVKSVIGPVSKPYVNASEVVVEPPAATVESNDA